MCAELGLGLSGQKDGLRQNAHPDPTLSRPLVKGERRISPLLLCSHFQITVNLKATQVAEKCSALAISVELTPEGGSEPRLSEPRWLFTGASLGASDWRSDSGT
ncbi:MAG: hypothetical protein JXB48_05990 [Candidatus Latescibacteria bacterium]|nr:hypothetical protein [Candidatus Latescibacterota bacterium]